MTEFILTRRRMIQAAAAATASSFLPGCSSTPSSPGSPGEPTQPPANTNPQPTPSGPLTAAMLTVTATATGTIGPSFIGLSYDKLSMQEPEWTPSNANMIAMFKLIDVAVLRLGDGSNSVYTPNGAGRTAGQIANSDITALAGFVKAAGCQCLYGTNLGGYGPGGTAYPTTPAIAAAEVAYANQAFGSSLYGIEIGNEPDAYISTFFAGLTPKWNVADLESVWQLFRNAIVAMTPGVPITGPATGTVSPVVTVWTQPFGLAEASSLSLLTTHYYRANGQAAPLPTSAQLVLPDTNLTGTILPEMQATSKSIGVPYRISECNSYYNGGAVGVSDSYASSLWVLDFMYNCAAGGSVGVTFHGGSTLQYTAIQDNNGTVTGARPLYYGILMFALAGQGTLYTSNLLAGSLNATAYSVKTAAGLSIIVDNKDSAQNLQLTIQLPQTANTATLIVMTQATSGVQGPSLTATSGVTIQGAIVNPDGTFSPNAAYTLAAGTTQITCYVPYLSAVLIKIT